MFNKIECDECDHVVLVSKDYKKINCLKSTLARSSLYFHVMFERWHSEYGSGGVQKCKLPTITMAALVPLVEYMKTGVGVRLEEYRSTTKLNILKAAQYLCIDGAVEQCEDHLVSHLCPGNALQCLQSSQMVSPRLTAAALQFIFNNFREVSQVPCILHLPEEELVDLLASDLLQASEIDVWRLVASYSNYPYSKPSLSLLQTIRFGLLDVEYFRGDAVLRHCLESTGLPAQLKQYEQTLDVLPTLEHCVPTPWFARPRHTAHFIFSVGESYEFWWRHADPLRVISVYNPNFDIWTDIHVELPVGCFSLGCAYYQGGLYLAGGVQEDLVIRELWRLDLQTSTWTRLADMNFSRKDFGLICLGDFLYAVGGRYFNSNPFHTISSIEQYDLKNNRWKCLTLLHRGRSDLALAVWGQRLYVIGGKFYSNVSNTIEFYDLKTKRWRRCRPRMSTPRSQMCALCHGNNIYVVGGWNGQKTLSSCEVYNVKINTWRTFQEMNYARRNHTLELIDNHLVVAGGLADPATALASSEAYNFKTGLWTVVGELTSARFRSASCLVPSSVLQSQLNQQLQDPDEFLSRKREAVMRRTSDKERFQPLHMLEFIKPQICQGNSAREETTEDAPECTSLRFPPNHTNSDELVTMLMDREYNINSDQIRDIAAMMISDSDSEN